MDQATFKALRETGDGPCPDKGSEFDAMMVQVTQTRSFEDPKTGEKKDLSESTERAAKASGISCVTWANYLNDPER
jgi:hypothetical protein